MDMYCNAVLKFRKEDIIIEELREGFKKSPVMTSAFVFFTIPVLPIEIPRVIYRRQRDRKFVEQNLPKLVCNMFYDTDTKESYEFIVKLRSAGIPFNIIDFDEFKLFVVVYDPAKRLSRRELVKLSMLVTLKPLTMADL